MFERALDMFSKVLKNMFNGFLVVHMLSTSPFVCWWKVSQ